MFDGYQKLFPLERTTAPALVVAIDEDSIARFGQWPWPRTRVAELIDRIGAAHPARAGRREDGEQRERRGEQQGEDAQPAQRAQRSISRPS